MRVRFDLDMSGLDLDKARHAARDGAGKGLAAAAAFARGEANRTVPIEEGVLQRSGGIAVDAAAGQAAIYYDTPYAVVQHENTTYRHDPGRRAKWLELTLHEQHARIVEALAAGVRGSLG